MFVRNVKMYQERVVGDNTNLKELLNPGMEGIKVRYSLAQARVEPGRTSHKHRLKSSEVYYILDGVGRMHIDDETEDVFPGCVIYIPPNSTQWIESTGETDLLFLCIVDPAWKQEDDELVD